MAFPTSPTNNQVAIVNGIEYYYNTTKGAWYRYGDATANVITSNTFQVLSSLVFLDTTSQNTAFTGTAIDPTARIIANAGFLAANTADQRAVTSGSYANSSYIHANAAFAAANSANITAQAAFNTANNASDTFARAQANASFGVANSASSYANGAFTAANTADQKAVTSGSYANSAYTAANTADQRAVTSGAYANSAFAAANTKYNSTGGTISGDVVVTGNLTVSGETTYANSTVVNLGDAIITLNADIPQGLAPSENAGIEIDRGSSDNVSLLWNETSDKWTFTNDGTNYSSVGSAAAESYANGAFAAANTADQRAVTSGDYANSAFTKANSALSNTNLNVSGTLRMLNQGGDEGGEIFLDRPITNTSLAAGVTIDIFQNKLRIFETGGSVRGVFIDIANSAAGGVGTDLLNPTATPDAVARAAANAAFGIANSASSYANGAFVAANTADQKAVTSGDYANAAFGVANSASSYANGAFAAANTADQKAVTSGSYANSSYIHANAAFAAANTTSATAQAAFNTANNAVDTFARIQANAAFDKANTAEGTVGTLAYAHANASYVHANAAFAAANSATGTVGQAAFNHANGAFALANSGGSQIYVASLQNFTSNGQNTTFTLSTTPTSANQLFVYVDGIYQQASAYTLSNNIITLSEALDANAVLEVRVFANTTTAHINNQIDTFTGTGACTTFTLTSVPRDKNLTTIIVGGVPQLKSAYNISGSSLVFSGAPANGASIEVSTYSGGGSYATSFTSVIDTFTGDNSTTTFTLSTLPQSENQTFAFVNGVYQQKNTYSLSGANIVFTATATSNDTIEVVTVAGSEMNVTSARYNSRVYTGTGACTSFTISSSHTANSVLVFENGICQEPITDYSVSGTTLTFTTAPSNGVKIQIRELPV